MISVIDKVIACNAPWGLAIASTRRAPRLAAAAVAPEMGSTIELYPWVTPSGYKISIALEELGLTYQVFPVDIGAGA